MASTIAALLTEARAILQDVIPTGSPNGTRYSNQDLLDAFNDALLQARAKRPDLFLDMGLRNAVPRYNTDDLTALTAFPIDQMCYGAFLYYIVGRSELRDDTFADDKRSSLLLEKFIAQLMQVAS
jgi:hypothetical protein